MTIEFKTGNILDSTEDTLGHQTNCLGIMGAGLAKQIKSKYPNTYLYYKWHCDAYKDKRVLLGTIFITDSNVTLERKIVNIFGQITINKYARETDYDALLIAFETLEKYCKYNSFSLALPFKIGCGLANGDWAIVFSLIKKIFENSEVKVVIYKLEGME